jgi:hypothetical protein
MTSQSGQRLLELVASTVGFKYLMYVPPSCPHRSDLHYKWMHARCSLWKPLVDDGGLFRHAVTGPAVNLQKIVNSVSQDCQDKLGICCTVVREASMRVVATMVRGSCSSEEADPVNVDIEVAGDKQ